MYGSLILSGALLAASTVNAQTPPTYPPVTWFPLVATYSNGNSTLQIHAHEQVSPNDTKSPPALSLPAYHPSKRQNTNSPWSSLNPSWDPYDQSKHMLIMLDLDIDTSSLGNYTIPTTPPLAPGLAPNTNNRTTYLHWLQGNLTMDPTTGIFAASSGAIAPYTPPGPPKGDITHTYAFWLFRQPEGYVLPEGYAGRNLTPQETPERIGFDLTLVAEQSGVGSPVAGTYMRQSGN